MIISDHNLKSISLSVCLYLLFCDDDDDDGDGRVVQHKNRRITNIKVDTTVASRRWRPTSIDWRGEL